MRDWAAFSVEHPEAVVWVDGRPLPVIAGGGGGSAKVPQPPGPTAQEIAIQEQQLSLLKIQVAQAERQNVALSQINPEDLGAYLREEVERARQLGPVQHQLALRQLEAVEKGITLQEQLQPFVLQSMRLVEDPAGGGIRRMTEDEYVATLDPTQRKSYDNLLLSLDRESKALRGELPLTEAGQQRKRDEFTAFKEQMARGGNPIEGDDPGSATSTTTPGIQALRAFNERWGVVEEAERRGELTEGSQAVLARLGVASDLGVRQREGLLGAVPQYGMPGYVGTGGRTSTGVGAVGSFFQSTGSPDFAGALQPYQAQRAGQYSAGVANAQIKAQQAQQDKMMRAQLGASSGALLGATIGSIFPVVGTAIGGAAGALIGGGVGYASSERSAKKDIRRATRKDEDRALAMVRGLPTHAFRYKGESGRSPKRMGMMVDEAPASLVTPDGRGIDLHRQVGLLTAATRALARQKGR